MWLRREQELKNGFPSSYYSDMTYPFARWASRLYDWWARFLSLLGTSLKDYQVRGPTALSDPDEQRVKG